jgi:hypothetical protein
MYMNIYWHRPYNDAPEAYVQAMWHFVQKASPDILVPSAKLSTAAEERYLYWILLLLKVQQYRYNTLSESTACPGEVQRDVKFMIDTS